MAEKRDDYKFMKINDAILSINQKVNIVGVVEEYGIPIKSRGSGISFAYLIDVFNMVCYL